MADESAAHGGTTSVGTTAPNRAARLRELACLFLRLGVTGFGGPAAHIALMRAEVVERRGWLRDEEFLDLLGATNLIPGPNSTEMAIHIGRQRAGAAGLIVAGACFILPAALIVATIAAFYGAYGQMPAVAGALYGVKPVMIAIVADALVGLARTACRRTGPALVAAASLGAIWLGADELAVLLAAGLVLAVGNVLTRGPAGLILPTVPFWPALGSAPPVVADAAGGVSHGVLHGALRGIEPSSLFFIFAKIGSILFGSGYVLLAFVRAELVERRGVLSEAELLDAIAVGQVTPGPVFTTATFIGHRLAGGWGAVAATVGIFLPAFIFVALSAPLLPRLRRSETAGAFLDGVNAASLALMAAVSLTLGRAAIVDVTTAVLALVAAAALASRRVSAMTLVVLGLVIGLVTSLS